MKKIAYISSMLCISLSLSVMSLMAADVQTVSHQDDPVLNALQGKSRRHHESNYALLSNQAAVTTGESIPWSAATNVVSEDISVNSSGYITFNRPGLFWVEYTVRINKTPYDGTEIATVQLQQTVSGVATSISQAAVTSNSRNDGVTAGVPVSQTQITGFALVQVSSTSNNVINLLATLNPGTSVSIPATTGTDANAQLVIVELR